MEEYKTLGDSIKELLENAPKVKKAEKFFRMKKFNCGDVELFFHDPDKLKESNESVPTWYKDGFLKEVGKSRIVWIAVAWFRDIEILEVAVSNKHHRRRGNIMVIMNEADLNQTKEGIENIIEKSRDLECAVFFKKLGTDKRHRRQKEIPSMMHHKFICLDTSVWTGSYNLSYQARNNYELMMRFSRPEIIMSFRQEFFRLWEKAVPVEHPLNLDIVNQPCPRCGRDMDLIKNGLACVLCGWNRESQS